MNLAYLDTSAAMKILIQEPERDAFIEYLSTRVPILTASWLLFTELHCAAGRRPEHFDDEKVRSALDHVEFVEVSQQDFIAASRLAPLRSNDAIHLAVAQRLQVDEILTYDQELIEAAARIGMRTVSPS